MDPKDEAAALEEIDICLKNLNITRNALNEKDEDYKSIMLRLQIAFKIAKENEHLLTEAQRQLVDVRIQEENQTTTSIDDWLPIQVPDTSVMPTKDEIALSFYEKLSEENKVKFDKLHRFLFYCSFAHHIEVFQKEIHHPDNTFDHPFPRNPECIIFSEKGKFDSLLTSRMAILALKAKRFVIDKDTFIPIRSTAIQQLEEEQMKALGNENVQQFIEGEVELRNSVDEWITQQID